MGKGSREVRIKLGNKLTQIASQEIRAKRIYLDAEFQVVDNSAVSRRSSSNADLGIYLTPESKEKLKLLDSLTKEGFRVRDLFISIASDDVSVLLERSVKAQNEMPADCQL
jgi:hypothetical protein